MPNNWREKVQESLLTLEKLSQYRELKVQAMAECQAYKDNLLKQKRLMIDEMKRDLSQSLDLLALDVNLDQIKDEITASYDLELSQLVDSLREDKLSLSEFMFSYQEFASIDRWPSILLDVGDKENVHEVSESFVTSTTDKLDVFGLLEAKIPPEEICIQKLAERNDVLGVYDSESKSSAPGPVSTSEPKSDIFDYVEMIWPDHDGSHLVPEPGKGVKICIIDSGIDSLNVSFNGKIIISDNFTSDMDTKDYSGHGTHCAGLAGGVDLGKKLVTGVAPHATLLTAKIFPKEGGAPDSSILAALGWAYNQNIDVISMSLGDSEVPVVTNGASPISKACSKLVDLGIIVCVSAGNSGKLGIEGSGTITRPGDAKEVITVGAVDRHVNVARFSSRGPTSHEDFTGVKPNLVAPGVEIVSARASHAHFETGTKAVKSSNSLIQMDGTSMACPIVAGAAAVLLSYTKTNNIKISAKELINTMYETARPLPGASKYEQGHGLVQIHEALKKIKDNFASRASVEINELEENVEKSFISLRESIEGTETSGSVLRAASLSSHSVSRDKQKCSSCGKEILSKLSLGGTCQQESCESVICSMCWKIKKIGCCNGHSDN